MKAEAQLRAKLYTLEREAQDAEVSALRKSQVGTGDRAEKIRTYNYPQDRITDHRIGLTVHGIPKVLDGDLDAKHRRHLAEGVDRRGERPRLRVLCFTLR